jgi:SRSO17 transposase
MTRQQLAEARQRLEAFTADVLSAVGRSERRHWGEVYVRGLLLDGQRKSIQPMAERMPDGNEQALQQFVNQSPWSSEEVRRRLARKVVGAMHAPAAWVVDETGFPKQGRHSVGVARQYCGTLGKVGNCQVAVSLHYATADAAMPVDWALYLPEEWTEDAERRKRARIPETVRFRTKWELALQLLDEALSWELPRQPVVADTGYGKIVEFREGLERRGLSYVVGVDAETVVWVGQVPGRVPPSPRTGRPRTRWQYERPPETTLEVARRLPETAWREVTWREGTKGPMTSRFSALRVRTAHRHANGAPPGPEQWLLIEWPHGHEQPRHYWLSNLPAETTLQELVSLAMIRWMVEQDYCQLKDELGLDHYEGRGWPGWHHHVTLVSLAYGFLVLEQLRGKKNFWVDPPAGAS